MTCKDAHLTSSADHVSYVVRRTAGTLRHEPLFLVSALRVCGYRYLWAVLARHKWPSPTAALGMDTRTYPSKAQHFLVGHVSKAEEDGEKEERQDT